MKHGLLLFAKAVVYLLILATIAVCFILLPELAREEAVGKPVNPYVTYGFLTGAYILAIPFFVALFQTLNLLRAIEINQTLSKYSIKALQNINYCVFVFIVLLWIGIIAGISVSRTVDPREDITFMFTLGGMSLFVSSVIAVFVAVLQKLLTDAISLKSENDLIV